MRFRSTGHCLDDTVKYNSTSMSSYTWGREDFAGWTFQGLPSAVSPSSCDGVIEGKGYWQLCVRKHGLRTWPQCLSLVLFIMALPILPSLMANAPKPHMKYLCAQAVTQHGKIKGCCLTAHLCYCWKNLQVQKISLTLSSAWLVKKKDLTCSCIA